ncbi:MAG: adenylate/guanylate cyclase domain-containing protein [Betaproteobacteria bacterium]
MFGALHGGTPMNQLRARNRKAAKPPRGANFGAATSVRKRVRNVAILFADVEGCTRLCEDLPPLVMERIIRRYFSRFLDVIENQGGRVTEILGDGLLALFEGRSPKADAARALSAALGIVGAAEALNAARGRRHDPIIVNIGINAGPALVGTTRLRGRTGERGVYSASGPVTNVAARLCALATQGQILLTGAVARTLDDNYPARRLGRRRLKNVSAPVEVFEIRARAGAP